MNVDWPVHRSVVSAAGAGNGLGTVPNRTRSFFPAATV